MDEGLAERLWARVDKTGSCWLWLGCRQRTGYGRIASRGKVLRTHRVAYELCVGTIPAGLSVCHHCDVRHCLRPEHLYVATHAQNLRKHPERAPRGERNSHAKLTEADVIAIRRAARSGTPRRELRERYGVAKSSLRALITGQTWKHIPRD